MLHKSLAKISLATALAAGLIAVPASAAPVVIDSIATTGDTLDSVTVGSTTYNVLVSPTSITSNTSGTDLIHKDASPPASVGAAISSLDLGDGVLNHAFEAQFGGALTDDTLIFLIINEQDNTPPDDARVYALDSAGNRLSADYFLQFGSFGSMPVLVGSTTYNRTTNGSAGADLSRTLVGAAFTLNDLGLGGLGATGIEFANTTNLDPQEIGLAVPEPATLALLGLGGLMMLPRRRA